jgi:hypothetical protein
VLNEYSLLRAEGFSCSLDVLYGGIGSGSDLYSLIPDPDPEPVFYYFRLNTDSDPWF